MLSYTRFIFPQVPLQTVSSFCLVLTLLVTPVFGQQTQVLLGDRNIESLLDSNPSGTAEAFPVQAMSTGQVSSLAVFLDGSNAASTIWVGMYASANGHPQRLLSEGAITRPLAGQWNSVTLPAAPVTAGTTYWLALLGVNGVARFRDRNGSCRSEVSNQTNLGALPATWSTGSSWSTCIVSMFESGIVTTGTTPPGVGISVNPRSVSLQAGQQQQFAAAVTGASNPAVTWTASAGSINSSGLYTAPKSAGTYTVTANVTSGGSSTSPVLASASAVVTVTLPTPPPPNSSIQVSVSPTSASLQTGAQQQFLALVSNTSNTAVIWSTSRGSIAANGLYTAPAGAGVYTITAVSKADTTKSASAVVTVSAPQPVAVTISPANASVGEAKQLQFTAVVSGVSNKAVTWSVTRGKGTITQSGLYTAPQAAESDVIAATSQADSTKSASASITVVLPHSVSLRWSAPQAPVAYYKVYRGATSGGPYTLVVSNIKATVYTDSAVQSGATYYYVTTDVDAAGEESIFSNELRSVIPSP
jgi:hypothetical protein